MRKYLLLIMTAGILFLMFTGCGTSEPYASPSPGDPRAYLTVENNSDFLLYVYIDDKNAGTISKTRSETYEVAVGTRVVTLKGTDNHYVDDTEFPVFFETDHSFTDGETWRLPVRFGVE